VTITVLPTRNEYTATAGQTVFTYTFRIFESTDLNVYITPAGQEADDVTDITMAFTVTGVGDTGGGTIVLNSGASAGDLITIVSDIPASRTTDYQVNGDFRPTVVNEDFDRVVSLVKQVEDVTNRSIVLPESQQGPKPLTLPVPEAGLFLKWNAGETGVENSGAPSLAVDTVEFNVVSDMIASTTLNIGDFVQTSGYTAKGDSGDNIYEIVAAATGTDDGGSFIDLDTHQAKAVFPRGAINAAQFGAVGDGVADDEAALQSALNYVSANDLKLGLLENHAISSLLTVSGSIELVSNSTVTTFTPTFSGDIFFSNCMDFKASNISFSGSNSFIKQLSSFNKIELQNIRPSFTADTASLNLFHTDSSTLTGDKLIINNCETVNGTPVFADNLAIDSTIVTNNVFNTPTQFVFRILDQLSTGACKNILFDNNWILSMNGNHTDKSVTARCLQVEIDNVVIATNNLFDGAESTTAANFVYLKKGSLICTGNTIKSISTINSISVIDDKGTTVDNSTFMIISNNTFNQTIIPFANTPEAMIRINEKRNVSVHNNKFRGLTCYPCRFYNSVDAGNYPENLSFSYNEIYDQEWPVACQVFQTIRNVAIKGNMIYSIKNPLAHLVNGETRPRVADLNVTFSNGVDQDGITIEGNVVYETDTTAAVMTIFRNAAAVTSSIINVSVINNEMKEGTAGTLVRHKTTTSGKVDIINNIGPSGMTETVGAEPAGNRKVNNVLT